MKNSCWSLQVFINEREIIPLLIQGALPPAWKNAFFQDQKSSLLFITYIVFLMPVILE